ncbi:aminoglycoside phosphotransferase family protein [Paractinoplanes ferrugineus]|uniref:Phosphotransferase n=1 Tax=Paractinoplanes ferrugineus TaxID=113564 RepID=A0A919J8J1_9ACTN|nr:aminoglycoside phosphotransferase family protein [Actinoplanes ferrugineus]GIE12516.1 phosphotransferase [Actinoplanes ferrugineus]
MKLRDGELDITGDMVRRLLAAQFPAWAGRELRPVAEGGTEHLMFRLGEDLVVRLPRLPSGGATVERERRWLPYLAPHLPLAIPEPVGFGRPGEGCPLPWSVYRWRPGDHHMTDPPATAAALGDFVAALQRVPVPPDAPPAYRGGLTPEPAGGAGSGPGREVGYARADAEMRAAARDLRVPAVLRLWDAALELPGWAGPPVWVHSDLLPGNVLFRAGRLDAVIDFGCAGVGDPAADLMAGWAMFGPAERRGFRARLAVDDDTWARGRAYALVFGLAAWHYYRSRKPAFAALGRRTVNQALTD